MSGTCNFFWGSHGCDLPRDGHRLHRCGRLESTPEQLRLVEEGDLDPRTLGPCCEYDEDRPAGARVRWAEAWSEGGPCEWGPWLEYGEGWRQ